MRLRITTAALALIAASICFVTPARADRTKGRAFDLLKTDSKSHELADAYLLSYASCFVFADLLGVKKLSDHKEFTQKFAEKFEPLGVKKIAFVAGLVTGTEAVVMSTDRAVLVVFRGSESGEKCALVKDWLTNLNALLLAVPDLGDNVKVHRGMWKAVDAVYATINKEVEKQGGFDKKRLYTTGHSMGGGLALIYGTRVHADRKSKPTIYTFGGPRVGNPEFKKLASNLTVHRWVNKNDIVPMVPSDRLLDYRHVGTTHHITKTGLIQFDSSEFRGKGSTKEHHVYRYVEAIHEALPKDLKDRVPSPP